MIASKESLSAMENWGLITYGESALLYDNKHTSLLYKELIATVRMEREAACSILFFNYGQSYVRLHQIYSMHQV
jgi:hypothetical protein